jgi:thioredoxin-like negative regulator of GroEL
MLHVLVFRDEQCETCDEVLNELHGLQNEFSEMRIRQRVLDEEAELAARLGVVATPAIVVNGQLAFQGHPEEGALRTYLKNVQEGRHDDPYAYPPEDERHPENRGQEATGSMDPEWRGSGKTPSFGSSPGGRH